MGAVSCEVCGGVECGRAVPARCEEGVCVSDVPVAARGLL